MRGPSRLSACSAAEPAAPYLTFTEPYPALRGQASAAPAAAAADAAVQRHPSGNSAAGEDGMRASLGVVPAGAPACLGMPQQASAAGAVAAAGGAGGAGSGANFGGASEPRWVPMHVLQAGSAGAVGAGARSFSSSG